MTFLKKKDTNVDRERYSLKLHASRKRASGLIEDQGENGKESFSIAGVPCNQTARTTANKCNMTGERSSNNSCDNTVFDAKLRNAGNL